MPRLEAPTRDDVGIRLPGSIGSVVRMGDINAPFRAASQALGVAQQGLQQEIEADREFELQSAKTRFMIAQDELVESLDDQDPDTYAERYTNGIQTIREKAYEGVKSSRDRQLLDMHLDALQADGLLKVNAKAKVKYGDLSRATLLEDLDGVRRRALVGDTAAYIGQAHTLIQGAVKDGLIDAEAGVKLRQEFAVETAIARIDMLPADKRLAMLNDDKDKVVQLLPPDVRATMIEKTEVEMRAWEAEARTQARYAEEERFRDLFNKLSYASADNKTGEFIASISPAELASLTPEHQKALREIIDNRSRGYAPFNNPAVVGRLTALSGDMSPEGRRAWAAFDVEGLYSQLSPETAEQFVKDRNKVRGQVVGDPQYVKAAQDQNAAVLTFLESELQWVTSGEDAEDQKIGTFKLRLQDYMDDYMQRNGVSQVPMDEFRRLMSRTAADVLVAGPRAGDVDDVMVDVTGIEDEQGLIELFAQVPVSGKANWLGVTSSEEAAAGWTRAITADLQKRGKPVTRAAMINRFTEIAPYTEQIITELKKANLPVTEENLLQVYDRINANRGSR